MPGQHRIKNRQKSLSESVTKAGHTNMPDVVTTSLYGRQGDLVTHIADGFFALLSTCSGESYDKTI